MTLPEDPVILVSYLNTKLRDQYPDLESLREGLDLDPAELSDAVAKLAAAGFSYSSDRNQFI